MNIGSVSLGSWKQEGVAEVVHITVDQEAEQQAGTGYNLQWPATRFTGSTGPLQVVAAVRGQQFKA